MSFISLSQTFVRSTGQWDKFEWDSTLGNQYQLFKYLSKFRYLGIENVSREFLMEGFHINGQFVENSTKENKAEEFLLLVVEIVNSIFGLVSYLLLTITFLNNLGKLCFTYIWFRYQRLESPIYCSKLAEDPIPDKS